MFRRLPRSVGPSLCAIALGGGCPGAAVEAARPFPQHTVYAQGVIRPAKAQAVLDEATRAFYESWKRTYLGPANAAGQFFILNDEEKKPTSTSEGHGYGMLIVAFMAGADPKAHELFDSLFRYYRAHPSSINPRLMAWRQEDAGDKTHSDDMDSATDGDLDIAQALLLADTQWGSTGTIDYRNEARQTIAAIKKDEINRENWSVKLGDWTGPDDRKFYHSTRASDFMPDHFRSFAAATGDADWGKVTETCYRLTAAIQTGFSPTTGLLPDFIVGVNQSPAPATGKFLEGKHDGHFSFNSCRVPFRLGVDFLIHGEPRAKTALEKMNVWFGTETGGKPENVLAGYQLDGKPIHKDDHSMAFTACLGVAAMSDAKHQAWLNSLWDYVVATDSEDDRYFARTLKMLSMVAMSGNWWSPGS